MRGTDPPRDPDPATGVDQAREHGRKPVLWAGRVETETGAHDCIALDLSLGGAKVRLAQPLAKNTSISLVIPRIGMFRATVMWQSKGPGVRTAGIHFTDPPEVVARTLRRALPV